MVIFTGLMPCSNTANSLIAKNYTKWTVHIGTTAKNYGLALKPDGAEIRLFFQIRGRIWLAPNFGRN